MNKTEFKTLMTRHLLGIADEEEESILNQMLHSDGELSDIGAKFCARKDFSDKYEQYGNIDSKIAFEKFQKVVNQGTIVDKKLVNSRWWNTSAVSRIAAAVIPLVLLVGGIYYYYQNRVDEAVLAEAEVPSASIPPSPENPLIQSEKEDKLISGFTPQGESKTVKTSRSGSRLIALEDGTRIHLNACSSVTYPEHFLADTREVILEGEGYFEIAKDAERPFIVHVAEAEVKQYGTKFNINAYDEKNIKVTLAQGSIGVTDKSCSEKKITPNHSALITASGIKTFADNVELATEWMRGVHHFNNEKVSALSAYLQRMYVQNVTLTPDAGVSLSGVISNSDAVSDIADAINCVIDDMPIESDRNVVDVQNRRVTMSLKGVDGSVFLEELHKQTGISFVYDAKMIAQMTNIVVRAKNESIGTVLHRVFTNSKFQYHLSGNVLTIKYNVYAQTTPPVLPATRN